MRGIALLMFLVLSFCSVSQQYMNDAYDTTFVRQNFQFSSIGQYAGNGLNNEMVRKLFLGGEITSEMINRSSNKHGLINRMGFDASSDFQYHHFKHLIGGKNKYGFLLNVEHSFLGGAIYSKDLFQLIFKGNGSLENNSADLSGSNFYGIGFQKIGLGLIDAVTKSSFSLNYYNISSYFQSSLSDFVYLQSEDLSQVDVKAKLDSDRLIGYHFNKGFGVGLDFDLRFPVQLQEGKKVHFQFLAKNIGFANFSGAVENYNVDTSYSYSGLTFGEIYGNNNVFQDDFDLMDSLNITPTINSKTIFLPGFIQIAKMTDFNSDVKIQSYFGVRVSKIVGYAPLMFIGAQYKFSNYLNIASHLTVGGFGNARVSAVIRSQFSKLGIGISTNDVYGLFNPKGLGKSLLINMRCAF